MKTAAGAGGFLALVAAVAFWNTVWPYLLAGVLVAGFGALAWWGWRVHRRVRAADEVWRAQDQVLQNNRSLSKVDVLTGDAFEDLVAARLREDGCTEVRRVGKSGDNARDIAGCLADGRTMVVQCKRFDPSRPVTGPDMQRLLGARTHFRGDVALFITNTRFTKPAVDLAVSNDIVLIHRDLLAPWLGGAALVSLIDLRGAGLGDRQHLTRWQRTYGRRRSASH